MQASQQVLSVWPRQFRQGRGSCQSPRTFGLIIPAVPKATSDPMHTDMLARKPIWQGCSRQSSEDALGAPRTCCPSCRELRAGRASDPRCTVLTHPGYFPAVWRRTWWCFVFPQATSQLEALSKLARGLFPSLPLKTHFSGELWEFTPPSASDTSSVALPKALAVTCGISSAVSGCTLTLRASHHVSLGNCGCALQVYSERTHAQGPPEHPSREILMSYMNTLRELLKLPEPYICLLASQEAQCLSQRKQTGFVQHYSLGLSQLIVDTTKLAVEV